MGVPIDRVFELLMAAIQGDNSMTDIVRRVQWFGFRHITDNSDCDSDEFFFRLRDGRRTLTVYHYRYPRNCNKERHIWFLALKGPAGQERYHEWVWSYRWGTKPRWTLIDETDTPRRSYADLTSLLMTRTWRIDVEDDLPPLPRRMRYSYDEPFIPGLLSSVNDNDVASGLNSTSRRIS